MPHDDWTKALPALEKTAGPLTQGQVDIASLVNLRLDADCPELVAAELLKLGLSECLHISAPEPAREGQLQYLGRLAEEVGALPPAEVKWATTADAWIEVFHARRAIGLLSKLKPCRGDVVAPVDRPSDVRIVTSIGNDGQVHLAGRGQRLRPHKLTVLARHDEESPDAEALRKRARNLAELQRKTVATSLASLRLMRPNEVERIPSRTLLMELEELIDSAEDERPLQIAIANSPELLAASIPGGHHGRFLFSQPALGSEYIPDFALCGVDSAGFHWTLVELESPRAQFFIGTGGLAEKARAALQQIQSWRGWLTENLSYARRSHAEHGLGLIGISPNPKGLVIVGRRGDPDPRQNLTRSQVLEQNDVEFHSYDWLLDTLAEYRSDDLSNSDVEF